MVTGSLASSNLNDTAQVTLTDRVFTDDVYAADWVREEAPFHLHSLPPGEYALFLNQEGHKPNRLTDLEVTRNAETHLGRIEVKPSEQQ